MQQCPRQKDSRRVAVEVARKHMDTGMDMRQAEDSCDMPHRAGRPVGLVGLMGWAARKHIPGTREMEPQN